MQKVEVEKLRGDPRARFERLYTVCSERKRLLNNFGLPRVIAKKKNREFTFVEF